MARALPGPLPTSSCNNCMLCEDCFPDLGKLTCVPQGGGGGVLSLGRLIVTYVENFDDYIPVKLLLAWYFHVVM